MSLSFLPTALPTAFSPNADEKRGHEGLKQPIGSAFFCLPSDTLFL